MPRLTQILFVVLIFAAIAVVRLPSRVDSHLHKLDTVTAAMLAQACGPNFMNLASPGYSRIFEWVDEAAEEYGVDRELIFAVILTESKCRVHARSSAGALGLMQLMPKTAQWLGVQDPLSPKENVRGGVKYLAQLLKRYSGDLPLALAAYNAGPATVRRYGGIPPFPETQNFVAKVIRQYESFRVFGLEA